MLKRFFVVMHFQRIENALKSISNAFWNVANAFQRKRNGLQIDPFQEHFQNIVNALSTTGSAFNETAAGLLESFVELLLLVTMKSLQ